jgi:hypothetical protein
MTGIEWFFVVTGVASPEEDEMTQAQSSKVHACPGATLICVLETIALNSTKGVSTLLERKASSGPGFQGFEILRGGPLCVMAAVHGFINDVKQ